MSTGPTPAGSAPGWHFAHGQSRGGPVSFAQLQKLAAAGKLLPTDRVLRPGGKQWETAGSLPALFAANPVDKQPAAAVVAGVPAARQPLAATANSAAAAAGDPNWHFARGQQRGGPVTFAQLKTMAAAGELLATDLVLRPGGKQWETAAALPALFAAQENGIQSVPARAGSAPAPAPGKRRALPDEMSAPPMGGGMRLVIVGAGTLFIAVIAGGLLWLCFKGDSSTQAEGPSAPQEQPGLGKSLPPPVQLTPRQKQIRAAVDKGAGYLRQRLDQPGTFYSAGDQESGAHPGAVALVGLTLLESGAGPNDAHVQKAAAFLRHRARNLRFTYSIAASILFLDRLHAAAGPRGNPGAGDVETIRSLALRLIASQNLDSGWDYFCQLLSQNEEQNLLARLKSGQFKVAENFQPVINRRYYDNSISQFVTLALWMARKHDVPVRASLLAVEQQYRAKQGPDGSWTYHDKAGALRDTSTCAGMIGLAVGEGIGDETKAKGRDVMNDPAIMNGLNYLKTVVKPRPPVSPEEVARRQKHTLDLEEVLKAREVNRDPKEDQSLIARQMALDDSNLMHGTYFGGDNWGDLYFLWSLERMAVIYGLDKIGDVDWHEWGTDMILEHQQTDGSWRDRFPGVPDTCFAMLFLLRANLAKDLTDKLRELMGGPGVQRPPGAPPVRKD